MPRKKKKKFTEDFMKKWKETTSDEEVTKTKRILRRQEELLKKHPKNVSLWFARGELLRSMGEHEKALKCYDAVVKLEPGHKAVHNARASALAALGKRDGAVESYEKALQLAKEAEEEVAEVEPAIEDLEKLIEEVTPPDELEEIAEEPAPPEEPEEYFACPMCGELLDPEESRCSTCGTEFLEEVDEEEILERLEALESDIMEEEEEEEEPSAEEQAYRKKLEKWRREGFNVLPLEEVLQAEPQRSRTAFFQFEENLKKVGILKESLQSMPSEGYEEDIEKIELMLRSPYKIWAIEAEMESLWQKIEAEQKREVAPPEREAPPRVPLREGLINGRRREGLIPPGRINGLINGIESAKTGLINGLTNGVGMTNGLGSLRFRREEMLGRWKLLLPIIVAMVLIASSFFVSVEKDTTGRIVIDGGVEDWSGIMITESRESAALNQNIDIVETAVYDDSDFLTFYVQVLGTMLQGNGDELQDTVFIFMDMDGSGATGYRIEGLGADRMIEVLGSDNTVERAVMYEFDAGRGSDDWSGWFKPRTLTAVAGPSHLEAEVYWDILSPNIVPIDVLFASHGFDGDQDIADLAVSNTGGSLEVIQESYISDWVVSGPNETLLRLSMTAHGTDMHITQMTAEMVGTASPGELSTVRLLNENLATIGTVSPSSTMTFDLDVVVQEGSLETFYVEVATTSASENTVGMRILLPSDIRTETGSVTLKTEDPLNDIGLGYLGSVKTGYSIDGAFSEWTGTPDNPGDVLPSDNPNIDLVSSASANETDNLYFFVEVDGQILKGTALPYVGKQRIEPSPFVDSDIDSVPDDVDGPNGTNINRFDFDNDGTPDAAEGGDVDNDGLADYPVGPDWYLNTTIPETYLPEHRGRVVSKYIGPVEKPPAIGEDVLRAYIDTEPGVGYLYDSETGFYADFLLEISGKNGDALKQEFLSFGGSHPGQWVWDPAGTVETEKDVNKLEAGVNLAGIIMGPTFDVRFDIIDWSGGYDSTRGTRYATKGDFGEYDAISKGAYNVYFTETAGRVKLEVAGNHFSWDLPTGIDVGRGDESASLGVLSSSRLLLGEERAIYGDAYEGIQATIEYEFGERSLKEDLILHSLPDMEESAEYIKLAFGVDYSDGLLPFVEGSLVEDYAETRSLDFYLGNRRVISAMPPYAYDAAGERLDCKYRFSPSLKTLETVCDANWFLEAQYPVSIDPSFNLTDDSTYVTDPEYLGRSVAVGDFDGDGYADVIAGAPFNSYDSKSFRGLAHIYFGPFTADDNSPDVTILGNNSSDQLGIAVAAGKLNGDAYWDAVVSQANTTNPQAYAYNGSASWDTEITTPNVTFTSQGVAFGDAIAVCNIDNSNYDDVVLGAPGQSSGGRAYVYQSPFSTTESTADDVLAPTNDKDGRFGDSLACGKIDNDNYYDVVVGEPRAELSGVGKDDGRVSIFYGDNIDFSAGDETPDSVLEYEYDEEQFGTDVGVGKINSDSYDDLVVGAQYNDEGGTDRGRAYVYLASSGGTGISNAASPDVEIAGQSSEERFGYAVFAGNIMGNSMGDVAIAAPYADEGGTSRGAVYVFEDPVNDNTTYDDKTSGDQDNELLGYSLEGGKFSNDDILVLAIGSPYWDDAANDNEGRVVVTLIPEFLSEIVPVAFILFVPIAVAYRRRRTT
ncbi:MAG: FG-GAP repeat protein [Thermoplasmata archaeon]|nr:FG-GAP repeat protein [Thermoplasmata archaeon]